MLGLFFCYWCLVKNLTQSSQRFAKIMQENKLLVSGKICLFILENTNFTNNTNRRSRKSILAGCYLCLSHTNQRSRKQLLEYHPDGISYSPLIKKYSSRMEICVIREIRVLLNIKILVFFG